MIDYKRLCMKMADCLYKYIENNHLKSICIGISGGIDSTISACIASWSCRTAQIPLIGRSLPSNTNKLLETTTADLVGKVFCNDYKVISIESSFLNIFTDIVLNEGHISKLQEGNIKARIRMIYLRHLASVHQGIVLDNDNFTEWNTGFWTVAGDSPMDYNIGLHYLWKTEIYELAHFLAYTEKIGVSEEQQNVIKESLKLVPTDGNGVSNSDCEQFELDNYEQVDDVLKTMYYSNTTKEEYIRLIDSYNEQGVDKVMMLHQNTEFKRRPAPIMPTKGELGL